MDMNNQLEFPRLGEPIPTKKQINKQKTYHNNNSKHKHLSDKYYRPWRHNTPSVPCTGNQFKLCSYNILADQYIDSTYTKHLPQQYIDFHHYRADNLCRELIDLHCDIICLQECNYYQTYWRSRLYDYKYESIYQQRNKSMDDQQCTLDQLDGVAIFYDYQKFTLLHSHGVLYDKYNKSTMNKPNCAVLAILQLTETPQNYLCVVNTHLLFNPKRGEIKLSQIQYLLNTIEYQCNHFLSTCTNVIRNFNIVVTGDFNSTPESHIIQYIIQQKLRYTNLDRRNMDGQHHHSYSASCTHNQSIAIQTQNEQNTTRKRNVDEYLLKPDDLLPINIHDTSDTIHHNLQLHSVFADKSIYQHLDTTNLSTDQYNIPFRYRPTFFHCEKKQAVDYIMYTPNNYSSTTVVQDDELTNNYNKHEIQSMFQHQQCTAAPLTSLPTNIISPAHNINTSKQSLCVTQIYELPQLNTLHGVNVLPTRTHSSDHFPLAVQFQYVS